MRDSNLPPFGQGYGWRRGPASAPPHQMRVSDVERREIAEILSQHFAEGRLDQSEFDERMSQAMAAKTRADLSGLLADLPSLESPQQSAPVPQHHRSRARNGIFLLGIFVLFVASSGWMWHSFVWRGFFWTPHLGAFLFVFVLFMLFRRGRRPWHSSTL